MMSAHLIKYFRFVSSIEIHCTQTKKNPFHSEGNQCPLWSLITLCLLRIIKKNHQLSKILEGPNLQLHDLHKVSNIWRDEKKNSGPPEIGPFGHNPNTEQTKRTNDQTPNHRIATGKQRRRDCTGSQSKDHWRRAQDDGNVIEPQHRPTDESEQTYSVHPKRVVVAATT